MTEEQELQDVIVKCRCGRINDDVPIRAGLVLDLATELTALRERVKDYEDTQRTIMSERCGDEVHCTCVPPLRAEVKRLTVELAALREENERLTKAYQELELLVSQAQPESHWLGEGKTT